MKSIIASFILSTMAILGFVVPASAYVGQVGENAGTVASLHITTINGQYVYEVQINGLGTLCPGQNFAYVSFGDRNEESEYQAMSIAQAYGANLYIFWVVDANSLCHITRLYY